MNKFYKSRFNIQIVLLLLLMVSQANLLRAQDCIATVVSKTTLKNTTMLGIAYGNSNYVSVGSGGTILNSTDGKNWVQVKSNTFLETDYTQVVYGSDKFVAVGSAGKIVTSSDGTNWTIRVSGVNSNLIGVAYGSGKYIAATENGTTISSADGISWSTITTGMSVASNDVVRSIIYANGKFVIGQRIGSPAASTAFSSTTGNTNSWTRSTINNDTSLNKIDYINNKFWTFNASGKIYQSTDAISWSEFTASGPTGVSTQMWAGYYDGTKYYMFGSSLAGNGDTAIYTSTNGTSWTLDTPKKHNSSVRGASYINGIGYLLTDDGITYTENGADWRYLGMNIAGVVKNGMTYVAVGSVGSDNGGIGQVSTSTDFTTWTGRSAAGAKGFTGIVYTQNKYIAVGVDGTVARSTDAVNWTVGTSISGFNSTAVAASTTTIVAVGERGIVSSADGTTWTQVQTNANVMYRNVQYLNNRFIAVGYSNAISDYDLRGVVVTSTDGITWTDVTPQGNYVVAGYNGVAWNGSTYMLGGIEEIDADNYVYNFFSIQTSNIEVKTGYTDRKIASGSDKYYDYNFDGNISYQNGSYIISLQKLNDSEPVILTTSENSANWTANPVPDADGFIRAWIVDGTDFKGLGNKNTKFVVTPSCLVAGPDVTKPTVVISSSAGASGGSTSTSPIPFTATFSEAVTGFTSTDVSVGNGSLSDFSGSGTSYTFNIIPTAAGAVTVDITADVAYDAAANGNTAATQFSITVLASQILLSTNPTITFYDNSDIGFEDGIANDGDGGSTAVSDFNLQVYPIDDSGNRLSGEELKVYGADWSYPDILTYGGNNSTAYYGWKIKSEDGTKFNLNSLSFFNYGAFDGSNFTVEAFVGGSSKGKKDFTGNADNSYALLREDIELTSIFKSVDEIRVYHSSGNDSWIGINNIKIGTEVVVANTAPTATAVSINGTPTVGQVLTGTYTYSDAENNLESGTTFKWYRSDNNSGLNKTAISGATASSYTLVTADAGKYISFEATPRDGTTNGTPTESTSRGPVVATVVGTTLAAGDIAVLGINSDDTYPIQRWAFVPLVNLTSGTVIHFTDASYDGATVDANKFYVNDLNEGHMTWTVPSAVVAGTTFIVTNNSGLGNATIKDIVNTSYTGVIGSLGGSSSGFSQTGDQIIVYQGTEGTTVGATFIYAFNNGQSPANYPVKGTWASSGIISAQGISYLPTGLINGTSAIALTSNATSGSTSDGLSYGYDNMKYKGTTSGTKASLLAAIDSAVNWEGHDATVYDFATIGNFNLSANTPPTATAVSIGGTLTVGQVLTGEYTYGDSESNIENGSTFKWYRSDDNTGLNKVAIASATANTYTLVTADANKYISFEVTPRDGTTFGTAVESEKKGPINSAVSILYVNKNVIGGTGTGDSWINAKVELADALKEAKTNTAIKEIWVAKGTYKPKYSPEDGTNFGTDKGKDNTFLLVAGVKVYGGFGGTEITLAERNLSIVANASILSGDLDNNDQNDGTIIGNNAYHVVLSSGTMSNATLNGFTIKGGNASATGNISVNGNTIDQNKGGGLAIVETANLSLSNLDITLNNAGSGAGISNVNSSPYIEFAKVSYNKVFGGDGAGMANRSSSPKIVNSLIHHNGTAYRGGGIYNAISAPELINVTIADNIIAPNGSGVGILNDGGTSIVSNSIIWGDNASAIQGNPSTVKNSIVKDGYNGTNVINQDPKFNDASNGDYTLKAGSPAINNGNNTLFTGLDANTKDLAGNARVYKYIDNGIIDLGAYEVQSDVVIPTVASVTVPPNSTYTIDQHLNFIINFDEAVTVVTTGGTPRIVLTVGNNTRYAEYVSGSGSTALTFRYTVASGDVDSDGITIVALDLNNGSVKNSVGNDVALTLNNVGSTTGILVDGTPSISQTITFNILPAKTYGDTDFEPGATSDNSGIPITYTSSNTNVATIVNGKIHIISAGTSTITASQAGDATHNAATDVQQTLTVNKKTITVTAAAKSKTYGDADPALTYDFDPALVSGDSFTGSLERTTGSTVGTYPINQGTLTLNSNYTLTYVGADLTIGKKTITVNAAAKSKTYGDADPALTYDFAPELVSGDSFTGNLERTTGSTVGTYPINQGTLALNSNYTLTYVGADLTIGKKTITVTAAAKNKTYGDADPALTYDFAPALVSGDSFTGNLERTTGSTVGTYPINQGTLALNDNYTLTYVGANLTIGKKTITVTAAAKNKTYGDADPELTYTFAPELVSGDSFTGSLERTTGSAVGTYPINQGTLALNGNYTLTYIGADFNIGKKTITVTAAAKSKTYGDSDPALTYDFAPALVSGDSFAGNLERTAGSAVGTYPINKGTLALNSNYTLTYVGADLTIGKKTITVTAAAKGKTYGDADPALTYDFDPALVSGDSFTGNLERTAGSAVGTYPINKGTLALNSNYTLTYVGADLTIGKKTITVTAAAKSKTYGDADPALTYDFDPALVSGDSFTGNLERITGSTVGTYPINQGTLALNSNYTLTYVGADLTIGKKTITVTAAAKSKTYGDADPALTYDFAPALVSGDTFSGSLSRTAGQNVGTYAINQGTLALNSNYTLTYVGANLTIGKKTITVTVAAKSKTYGDADPALTYTFATALVTGDTFSGNLARVNGNNVGIYAINQGTLALNSNYTLTYIGANFTIGKKTIMVTAAAKSKTYGDVDPALTYDFAPALVSDDTFSGSLSRTAGQNVGTYAINQGTLALNSNYTLTYVGADLTIGKKTITVTAADKSKTYGDADPALTYTFAPALVTGDTFSGNLARVNGNNVGTYAINQGTLALNSNYTLTYIGANFTIGKKTIMVTAAAKSKTYGDVDPALTYDFAPALVSDDTFSGSLSRTAGQNVGTYAINQGTLALNSNYTLTYVGADLTIGKKTITVTAADKSKTYGDADPALTYTFAPALVTGDTFSGNLARVNGNNVGTYAINQGTLALNANYTLTYVSNNFVITAKPITVTANASQSKVYGTADPVYTYSVSPALVSGHSFTGALGRVAGNDAGVYAITQGTLNAGTNYNLTYVGSNFTIVKANQTITWNQTLGFGCEGETTVILTATSSSGLPVSYTSSNSNLVSISGNSLNLLNYGSVTISANQLGNNNYNPAVVVNLPLVNSQPNLIRKQFEDIIFFDNSSKSFSTYTWYKNGVLVPGQTDQYFKENGPLNGTYYAVATKLDGIVVTTCPLVLSPTVEDEYIKIVPNPVKPNASYELLNNVPTARLQNARIEVYSVGGLLLENKTTSQNTLTLKAPTVEGIYIIKMTLANGKYFTKNLLVKN